MPTSPPTITNIVPQYVGYMASERRFSKSTINKYRENLLWLGREIGELNLGNVDLQKVIDIKSRMASRGIRESRIASIIFALKGELSYARDVLGVKVHDLTAFRAPRPPRRNVVYLSNAELGQFISAISLETVWSQRPRYIGYCFRALVETLAATAMRISEALSLTRESIDFEKREARIIGKGNKERVVFFTQQAVDWIQRYLALRKDNNQALFVTSKGRPLKIGPVEAMFRRVASRANLNKRVTPHVLRHTAATNLLHKGCPVGFIKEILGHDRLGTTCRFYLGLMNTEDTRRAFDTYMAYSHEGRTTQTPFL